MRLIRLVIVFIGLSLFNFVILAQNTMSFVRIDKVNGLSNKTVNDIAQDSLGYLWFATSNGLNRYDGTNFKYFTSSNHNILNSDHIKCIAIDHEDKLWIGTLGGGLYVLNKNRDQLNLISNDILEIHEIVETDKHEFWIGAKEGLYLMQTNDGIRYQFTKYADEDIQSIIEKNGNVYMATSNGLFYLNVSNKELFPIAEDQLNNEFVFDIELIDENELWIATRHFGILVYDLSNNQLISFTEKIKKGLKKESYINFNDARKICQVEQDKIYIGTDGAGLVIYNQKSQELSVHIKGVNKNSIASNTIFSIFEDRNKNIWIGHIRKGISIINNNRDKVEVFYNMDYEDDYSSILSIFQEDQKDIIYGTDGKGLYRIDSDANKAVSLNFNPILGNAYVQSIFRDSKDNLWIGTFSKGIVVKESGKNKIEIPDKANDIRGFCEDSRGNIWIGSYGTGLFKYNPINQKTNQYVNIPGDNESLSNNNIFSMAMADDKIYLATYGGGLNIFDLKSEKFNRLQYELTNENSILGNNLICLSVDDPDNIWIGSSIGISNIIDDNNEKKVIRYSFDELSFDRYITAILVDDDKNVWFTTDAGIYQLQKEKKLITKVNLGSSFNTTEFHYNSSLKTLNGKLLFGSINGLFSFKPKDVYVAGNLPRIIISDFSSVEKGKDSINSKPNTKINQITKFGNVVVEPSTDLFIISFTSLEMPSSKEIEYAVKLDNFDKDWRKIGNSQNVTYTNIAPGNYTFNVKSNNIRGEWGTNVSSFDIEVLTPMWKRWWAKLLYLIVLINISLAVIKNFMDRAKMKNTLKLEKLNREKDEEIHQLQLAFFTNISHDIRTPLTLIIGNLKRLMKAGEISQSSRNSYHIIENNINRLLRLANELLDFRRIATRKLKLNLVKNNIVPFVVESYYSFYEHARERSIQYDFTTSENEINIYFDYDQLEKVIFNLLSNAFKYTPGNGRVNLKIDNSFENELKIEVQNSGQVLSEAQQENIFKRFYQTNERIKDEDIGPGNGIGLSIVKDIINLHNGRIEVLSNLEDGTVFSVYLPKGDAHVVELISDENQESAEDVKSYYKLEDIENTKNIELNEFKGLTLLVVEDNHELRAFLKSSLIDTYKIIEAENGKQALEIAVKELPDLILSDVMMPELDGISMCFQIKTNVKTSHIPVILLTARKSRYYKVKGLETGADDYISKPFYEDELKIRIRNLLKIRHDLREKFLIDHTISPEQIVLNSPDEKFIKDLCSIIEKNIENPQLHAEKISKELAMSHSLVYKKLKSITGMSIVEFVRDYRLKKAEMLLIQNKLSIAEVSFMVGFNDRNYFSLWFKKKFKKSPSDYMKSNLH